MILGVQVERGEEGARLLLGLAVADEQHSWGLVLDPAAWCAGSVLS